MSAFNRMQDAPKDRRILVKTEVRHYQPLLAAWNVVGYKWIEAWWVDGSWLRYHARTEPGWVPWAGAKRFMTTETIWPLGWIEAPDAADL